MTRSVAAMLGVAISLLSACGRNSSDETTVPYEGSEPRSVAPTPVGACDDTAAHLTARAYVLSNPLLGRENELIPLIEDNPTQFVVEGGAIQCMQALGRALTGSALAAAREFRGSSAVERFGNSMPSELARLPGQVDDSLQSFASDSFSMGQELLWLARVLPEVAKGNTTPYNAGETPLRQQLVQVLPMYRMLCQIDPSNCQIMVAMFQEVNPSLERHIYSLARQVGG